MNRVKVLNGYAQTIKMFIQNLKPVTRTMIFTAYLYLRPVYQGLYIYSNFAFHYLIIVKQNNVPRLIILFTKKKQTMYSK